MNYKKHSYGAYNIHFINTDKFNTISISIIFKSRVNKEDITKRNLLKLLLLDSTKTYKTEREMSIKVEDLYDVKINGLTSRIGSFSLMFFNMVLGHDNWTEEGNLINCLDFLMDIILNPNIENNAFNEDSFKKSKEILKQSILLSSDNKTKYSILKLLETKQDEIISYNSYGSIELLDKLTSKEMYEYYLNVIKNDNVDILILGNVDQEKINTYIKENFSIKTFKKEITKPLLKELSHSSKIKKYEVLDNVNQLKLSILCLLNNLTDYERKYVLFIYNEILGGTGGDSMLFNSVREKYSLAYYINSIFQNYDNTLIIYSGIRNDSLDLALKIIKKSMLDIKKGKFDIKLIENAKKSIISNLDINYDNPNAIINSYYYMDILGTDNLEKRKEMFNSVSYAAVLNIAKKINIDSILYLKGGDVNEKN